MKAPTVRDIKRRRSLKKFEEKRKVLKVCKANTSLTLQNWSIHKLSTFPTLNINTRCLLTGRGKAVNKSFKLSRLEFRRRAAHYKIPGLGVASW